MAARFKKGLAALVTSLYLGLAAPKAADAYEINFLGATDPNWPDSGLVCKPLDDFALQIQATQKIEHYASRYPVGMLDRFVDKIAICSSLFDSTSFFGGAAPKGGRTIYLKDIEMGVFDHEFFHIIEWEQNKTDFSFYYNWVLLDPMAHARQTCCLATPFYIFLPAVLYNAFFDIEKLPIEKRIAWAREEMAHLAERMMAGDTKLVRKAARDRVLNEKLRLIRLIYSTASEGQMDEDFWNALIEGAGKR